MAREKSGRLRYWLFYRQIVTAVQRYLFKAREKDVDNILKIKTSVGSRVHLCLVGFERAFDSVDRDICGSK